MAPLLYIAELALGEEDEKQFLDWYAFRHAPDLFSLGFQVCTSYRAIVGDMTFMDIYEIPNWEIFTRAGYAQMAENDVYAADILAKRLGKAHTIYTQRSVFKMGGVAEEPLNSDWIQAIRFDSTLAGDELAAKVSEETKMLAVGALNVRLAERTRDHPVYTTHRPHFLLLIEWAKQPRVRELLAFLTASLALTNAIEFVGRRVYPWPDAPPA